jgi:hypothetical protein
MFNIKNTNGIYDYYVLYIEHNTVTTERYIGSPAHIPAMRAAHGMGSPELLEDGPNSYFEPMECPTGG